MKAFFEAPFNWLENFGLDIMWIVIVAVPFLMYYVFQTLNLEVAKTFDYVFITMPIWLPIITFLLFFEWWMYYVRKEYDLDAGRVTLEISLPQEILKSPEAMELILIQLYQTANPDNHIQTYIDGKHPPTFGLEIISRGGNLKFYINIPRKKFKFLTESQLYAQYAGIEVKELEIDYMSEFSWNPKKFFYFSFHYGLKRPDSYPIKTYFDTGLQAMPKEEEKIDPITVALEILSSAGPGENLFLQILISAHIKKNFKGGYLKSKPDWKDSVKKEIEKIIESAKGRNEEGGILQLTEGEKDSIKSMERSVSKYAFDTSIRTMYIAEKDKMNPGERLGMLAGIFRQYDDISSNQIGVTWRTDTDWSWWQDRKGKVTDRMKKQELYEYKIRRLVRKRYEGKKTKFIFTTEELATVFHFPGQVAITQALGRIPSTRSEAPGNLPIG